MSKHTEAARMFGEAAQKCAEAAKAIGAIAKDLAAESLKESAHAIGDLAFGKTDCDCVGSCVNTEHPVELTGERIDDDGSDER